MQSYDHNIYINIIYHLFYKLSGSGIKISTEGPNFCITVMAMTNSASWLTFLQASTVLYLAQVAEPHLMVLPQSPGTIFKHRPNLATDHEFSIDPSSPNCTRKTALYDTPTKTIPTPTSATRAFNRDFYGDHHEQHQHQQHNHRQRAQPKSKPWPPHAVEPQDHLRPKPQPQPDRRAQPGQFRILVRGNGAVRATAGDGDPRPGTTVGRGAIPMHACASPRN